MTWESLCRAWEEKKDRVQAWEAQGEKKKVQGIKSNNDAEGGKCGGTEQEAKKDETMIDALELDTLYK